jgi:hypothetical protein
VNTELATARVVQQPKSRARKNRFIKMVRRASQSDHGVMNQIRDDVTPNAPPGRADNDAFRVAKRVTTRQSSIRFESFLNGRRFGYGKSKIE